VTCSGEKISSQLKREFFSRLNAELVVSYGCTEVPGAVSYVMTREDDPDHDVAGKVAPLMEAYVVDSALNILPVGVEGEIFLGGLMATGYLNNPLLTQDRFIANPFDTDKSSRLFKTGDRGCWVEGGFLQVKGRNDGLVKIRGYRVEITEVEETIARLPFVRQAAVVSEISGVGINNLMAFVAVSSGSISVGDIKIALSKMLPDYMIPSRFILADELPLTASGKIDRKALIPSSFENDKPMTLSRIPDNLERELISIWRGVLDVKKIDVRDNFFDLGGSSLLAAQMIDQVERFFDVRVPLDLVWFRGGTVESLAVILRDGSSGPDNMGLVNIKSGKGNPLFFVHVRGGHLSDYYHLARCMSPEQAVYGLQARGVFGIERPDSSVPEMAAYCIENMKRVQAAGPYMIAGYSSGGTVAFEMAKQLKAMEEEVRMLVLLDTFCPVVELSRRWKKAFMRLCEGKTHDLRDAVYASLIRGLKLEKMLKFRDLDSAHKWAYRLYKPSEERLSVEFIVAARSVEKINDDFLGWGNYLAESSSVSQFPGGHVEIIRYPTVIDVAKVLQSRIDALS
jgi:thioesterase domain-containing protein/acyl carrier protein